MNKKIMITAITAAAAVVAVLIIMFMQEQKLIKHECELYFLNESESTLVSEKRIIKYRKESELNEAVIDALIAGPESGKNKRAINRKAKLKSITSQNPSEIIIDFNYRFLSGDTSRDVLSAYAVVKTLCGIDGIDRVKVTVEKNDVPTAEGKPIGFLADEDINLSTDTNTGETREVTLYFVDKATKKLVPEQRSIKVNDQMPLAHYVINELIQGTQLHENAIDGDTMLIGVNITDYICFVNMQSNFMSLNAGSEEKEKLAVFSIVNSLTELDNIGRVQFLIDGKKVDKFGTIPFAYPFERDMSIIGG